MEKQYFKYLLTNNHNTVIYTGITSDLVKRVYEHRNCLVESFTKKYNVSKLIYYEVFSDPESAILREKQIKAGSRRKKVKLVESINPDWNDLYDSIL